MVAAEAKRACIVGSEMLEPFFAREPETRTGAGHRQGLEDGDWSNPMGSALECGEEGDYRPKMHTWLACKQ